VTETEAGGGDFGEFYRREYAGVVRLVFALCGKLYLAEEIAEDAFVAAYRQWDRVRTFDDPAGWVRRVATNGAISGFRRRMTELRALSALFSRRREQMPLPNPDQELWAAVRALPARQAQVVALMYLEDLTAAQIGEILGCGEETVRTHARRARATLAKRLDLEEEEG
jgi:RNA polymerase sigma factor (sigma-70 family)